MPRNRLQSVARVLEEQAARQLVSCWVDGKSKARGDLCLDTSDKVGTGRIYILESEDLSREYAIASHRKIDGFAM